ncbi:hypothetical protein IGX29_03570 [Streptomyces sp. H28]|uniref:WD40 repeat domain-containing protein n=1 Tax=Streptomyces sp. H28 TaxID=2775865 RepID=UPI00178469F3|nr:hypothetical protein [Streptomyces sp. H28]MBD9730910.1 hypothetical protein [Streptomyces sp. H28]
MSDTPDGRQAEIQRRIAAALLDLVPSDPTIAPHPYLRRHLAAHAAEGHVLDDDHVPPALLAWESSAGVARLLAAGGEGAPSRPWLQTWAALEPVARGAGPLSRLASMLLSVPFSPERPGTTAPSTLDAVPVTPLWSDIARPTPAWTAGRTEVTSLATVLDAAGEPAAVAAGDASGTVRVLHLDGRPAHTPIRVHSGAVSHLVAFRGGLVVTAGTDGCVAAVDAVGGRLVRNVVVCRERTWVSSLTCYRQQGRLPRVLAAFSDGTVTAFDTGRFRPHEVPVPPLRDRRAILCAVGMPDGRDRVLFTENATVSWSDQNASAVHSRHAGRVRALLALPRPGTYAVADESGGVSLCDLTARDAVTSVGRHAAPVTSLLLTSYERRPALVSGAGDGTLRLWRLPGLTPVGGVLSAHRAPVTALTAVPGSAHGKVLSSGADRIVRAWTADRETFGQPSRTWNDVTAGALSPAPPHLLAVARASRVVVRDLAAGRQLTLLKGHRVAALAWPRVDGRLLLAAALADHTIVCVDPGTRQRTGTPMEGHHLPVRALVALSSVHGDLLASGSADGRVCVWQPATGELVKDFPDHRFTVRCLATHQGRGVSLLGSGGSDGNIRIWNADTLEQDGPTLKCDQDIINDLAFLAPDDGGLLVAAAGQDGTLKLWDVHTGRAVRELQCDDGALGAVTVVLLPGERTALAATGATGIHIWDADTARPLLRIATGSPVHTLKAVQGPRDVESSVLLAAGEAGTMAFRLHHDRL